jgi:glutamate--cysteine ligase
MNDYHQLDKKLQQLAPYGYLLKNNLRGLEKESLRVTNQAMLSSLPHSNQLGSPLTHPYLTTDFAESQLEFVTPVFSSNKAALQFLEQLHQWFYQQSEELLWSASMPCCLNGEESIPIAQYGSSNQGLFKTIYRRGLGYRYGKMMQAISGVHFNFSFADELWIVLQNLEQNTDELRHFKSALYFGLIRNMQRFGWLVPYLFGASPAVDKSFLEEKRHRKLQHFDENTYFLPYATSLRLGDIGYNNRKNDKSGVKLNYDSVETYSNGLKYAVSKNCPYYQNIGGLVDGEYRQLNTHILQIENEYYSTIRAKQILNKDEKLYQALQRDGVAYIELRSLDVNPYNPVGVNEEQLYFLEILMLFCLLLESPFLSAQEREEIDWNQNQTAHQGRDPSLFLRRCGETQLLRTWASELCNAMRGVAECLDHLDSERIYTKTLEKQLEIVHNTEQTPSARILADMQQHHESFTEFAHRLSKQHRQTLQTQSTNNQQMEYFNQLAQQSLADQIRLETDPLPFEVYLQNYFNSND